MSNLCENMRWHFIDPSNETEIAYKKQKQAAISTFWSRFEESAAKLFEAVQLKKLDEVVTWVNTHVAEVDPSLMWDVSFDKVECCLVVTPETHHALRPMTETMIQAAPKVNGWRFKTYREPHVKKLSELDDSRIQHDLSDLHFVAHIKDSNVVDLEFFSSQFKRDHDQNDQYACFIVCELLLGEEILDKWIGEISTRCLQRPLQEKIINLFGKTKHDPAAGSRPADELLQLVTLSKEQILESLPDVPFLSTQFKEFTGMFIQPKGDELPSRFTFNTALPNIISTINNKFLFHSETFSKVGEKFCYIKIADMENIRATVEARGVLEDRIDAALRRESAGCVFGGGAGPECAFIDLILLDVDKAIPVLREVAKKEAFSDRSWLLFHDTPWTAEWVGLTPSSPVPTGSKGEW